MHSNAVNTTNAKVQECIDLYEEFMKKTTEMEHYYYASGVSNTDPTTAVGGDDTGVTFANIMSAVTSLTAIRDLGSANGRAHLTNLYSTR